MGTNGVLERPALNILKTAAQSLTQTARTESVVAARQVAFKQVAKSSAIAETVSKEAMGGIRTAVNAEVKNVGSNLASSLREMQIEPPPQLLRDVGKPKIGKKYLFGEENRFINMKNMLYQLN